jgi:hypothetical protein
MIGITDTGANGDDAVVGTYADGVSVATAHDVRHGAHRNKMPSTKGRSLASSPCRPQHGHSVLIASASSLG